MLFFSLPIRRAAAPRLVVVCAVLLGAAPPAAQASNLTWLGGFSANWNFFAGAGISNWTAGQRPTGGDDVLTFPSGGGNKTMNNDLAAGTTYFQLDFTSPGYTLNGNDFRLGASGATQPSITASHGAGTTVVVPNIRIAAGDTLGLAASSAAAVLVMRGEILPENGASSRVEGAGTVVLDGGLGGTFTLGTGADSPTLVVNGSLFSNSSLTVPAGATLAGTGLVTKPAVTVNGTLAPGDPTDISTVTHTRTLSFSGDVVFASTANLVMELRDGAEGLHDRLSVPGTVTANGARITLAPLRPILVGTRFTLIDNKGTQPIDNTPAFRQPSGASITEGTVVTVGTNSFRYSFTGGDGNDLTLTVVLSASSGSREWDAGGATQLFSEAANWTGNTLPVATNTLVFGTLAPSTPLTERFPVDDLAGNFYKLLFTAPGYALSQDPLAQSLTLSAGVEASHDTGVVNIDHDIILGAPQAFSLTGKGALRLGLNNSINLREHTLTVSNTDTGELRFNGPIISIGGGVEKTGTGFAVMGGASTNTYLGGTTVSQGELRLSRSSANGAVPGNLEIGGGTGAASVTTTATEQIVDSALVTVLPNGSLLPGVLETIGGLVMQGGSAGGAGVLAVAGNITATESGVISCPVQITGAVRDWSVASSKTLTLSGALTTSPVAAGITQRKTGPGTLVLSGTSAATTIAMDQGTLQIEMNTAATIAVKLRGGTVSGGGRTLAITSDAVPCSLSPGVGSGTALFECTQLALLPGNNLILDLNSPAAGTGYDVVAVANTSPATVSLGGALLFLRQAAALPLGTVLTIIDNDGTDPVSGTFLNQPQGSIISSDLNHFAINYAGGTGNDVVLTAVAGPEITMTLNSLPRLDGGSVSFPVTKVGAASGQTFTVGNTGTAVLTLSGVPRVQLAGADAAHFSISAQPPASVAAGTSATFTVLFKPTSAGDKTASLILPNNDTDEAPFNLTLTATATPDLRITTFSAVKPSGGTPGSINISLTGSEPNAQMRLQASSDLAAWTTLRTLTSDSFGGVTTGVISDPGNTNVPPRRFYRVTLP